MLKELLNVGDHVVFAQRYLPGEKQNELYGAIGTTISKNKECATVDFTRFPAPKTVLIADLEYHYDDPEDSDLEQISSTPDLELMEDHELGGMQRSQLIAHKILAQECDPALNREINQLLETQ